MTRLIGSCNRPGSDLMQLRFGSNGSYSDSMMMSRKMAPLAFVVSRNFWNSRRRLALICDASPPNHRGWPSTKLLHVLRRQELVEPPVATQLARLTGCIEPMAYVLGVSLCYAGGRVLTVRGHLWPGHWVHCGVHVFANLGNLLVLPLVR